MLMTKVPLHGIDSVMPHSVLRPAKPSPCLLNRSRFKSDGLIEVHQLGVESLDLLSLRIGDAEALQIQWSPGQAIDFFPARDASGIH